MNNFLFHPKASKSVENFYPSWDLMEICTSSNLVALAETTCKDLGLEEIGSLTSDQLKLLVDKIFETIHLLDIQEINGQGIQYFHI